MPQARGTVVWKPRLQRATESRVDSLERTQFPNCGSFLLRSVAFNVGETNLRRVPRLCGSSWNRSGALIENPRHGEPPTSTSRSPFQSANPSRSALASRSNFLKTFRRTVIFPPVKPVFPGSGVIFFGGENRRRLWTAAVLIRSSPGECV